MPNRNILKLAKAECSATLLKQQCIRLLGHTRRLVYDRLPNDFLHGELKEGKLPYEIPKLCFKDLVKRDLKAGVYLDTHLLIQTKLLSIRMIFPKTTKIYQVMACPF